MLVIWDSEVKVSDVSNNEYYFWNGYESSIKMHSLLKYIDDHDALIKERYLSLVYEIGEYKIGRSSLIDLLQIEKNFSFWWMTSFVEKNPWKQKSILTVLKLFAIEEILRSGQYSTLKFVGTDSSVAKVLKDLCEKKSIAFEFEKISCRLFFSDSRIKNSCIGTIVESFLVFGNYIINFIGKSKKQRSVWTNSGKTVFFCSYLFNLDHKLLEKGIFYTRFWESLHDLMPRIGLKANWLQFFYKHDKISNVKIAQKTLNLFNTRTEVNGAHTLLQNYLKCNDLFFTFSHYIKLVVTYIYFRSIKYAFKIKESELNLWPVMKMDWRSSIIGKSAIHGLINFQLFKNSLADIPIQRKGFYLFENQSWERAFIFAWKKNGHDQLIGVAHSTIRYWDLRYFSDKRSINSITVKGNKMPQPDFVALNGPLALESFAQSGHPLNRTIECEAVRFMNLTNLKRKEKSVLFSDMLKVLILGEYMPSVTDKMLAKLEKVSFSIERMISYAFKPHPNYYINPNKYPGLNLSIVTESLDNVLTGYDIVISSNSTSAAVDAYLAGISLVIFLDKYELNYSPLRNQPGVRFIYSHEELEKVLNSEIGDLLSNNYSHSFFFLDPNLPKWKKILEN